jgi:hypothetical protein
MRRLWPPVLLSIPLVLAMILLAWAIVAERLGVPTDDRQPLNIAEAAGFANAADVVRRLRMGEDPGRVYPLRAHVVSSSVRRATALEAALFTRRIELVRLFDQEGVAIEPETRAALSCLAADLELEVIANYLSKNSSVNCEKNAALERLTARTTEPTP